MLHSTQLRQKIILVVEATEPMEAICKGCGASTLSTVRDVPCRDRYCSADFFVGLYLRLTLDSGRI